MSRIATIALITVFLGVSTASADEAEEKNMKAWRLFVGDWKTINPDGSAGGYAVAKTKSGCITFQGKDLTLVLGWDTRAKVVKSVGLNTETGVVDDTWKLVGDGPRFEGHTEDGTKLSIQFTSKDRYELMVGDAKTIGERVK